MMREDDDDLVDTLPLVHGQQASKRPRRHSAASVASNTVQRPPANAVDLEDSDEEYEFEG